MLQIHRACTVLIAILIVAILAPAVSAARAVPDRDASEISGHALTEASLAIYRRATANLGNLSRQVSGNCADDYGSESLDEAVARINAIPGAQAAIQSAGMTTREYVMFTRSLSQSSKAARAQSQPGGKLPPGVSQANVDFYRAHEASLQKLLNQVDPDPCSAPAAAPGGIRISIKNVYEAELNFGALGSGWRKGTDRAEGELQRGEADDYSGIVQAFVSSEQQLKGLTGNCGPGHYEDSQKLQVTGHSEVGFNPHVQTVDPATMTGQASGKFLRLEFAPAPGTTLQPPNPNPDQDQVINSTVL